MQISGISALVTGGASGLGLATAKELTAPGRVRDHRRLARQRRRGGRRRSSATGCGSPRPTSPAKTRSSAAIAAAQSRSPLRAVVHCAGRGGDRVRIIDREHQPGALDTFRQVLEVNLVGTYNVLRLAAAAMSRNEPVDGDRGAIVLTASVAAFDGQIGQTSYTASKAAIHGITLVAARDLASWGIRVNTIAPGTFDTPMLARLRPDIRDGLAAAVPHPKRLG